MLIFTYFYVLNYFKLIFSFYITKGNMKNISLIIQCVSFSGYFLCALIDE